MSGEPKVTAVVTLSEKVIPKTSLTGQEIIFREVDACKSSWNSLHSDLLQVK